MKITDFVDENNVFYYSEPVSEYELTDDFKISKNITHFYVKYNIYTTELEYEVPDYETYASNNSITAVNNSVTNSDNHCGFKDMYEDFLYKNVFRFLPFSVKEINRLISMNKYVNIFHMIPKNLETWNDQVISLLNEGNTPKEWIDYVGEKYPHLLIKSNIFVLLLLEDLKMIRFNRIAIVQNFRSNPNESLSEEDIQKVFSLPPSEKMIEDPSYYINDIENKIYYILNNSSLKNVFIKTLKSNTLLLKSILRRAKNGLEDRLLEEICKHTSLT